MGFLTNFAVFSLGFFCIFRGLMALCRPQGEFAIIGILDRRVSEDDASSTPIFMLGIRDISMGFCLMVHQHIDNPPAVATLLLLLACFKLGDAVVVLADGNENKRAKATGHFVACLFLLAWSAYIGKYIIQRGSSGGNY